MSRQTLQLDSGQTILFSPDDPIALMDRWQALVNIRVIDEMTGQAPLNKVSLDVAEPGLIPRIASNGVGGVVGIPRQAFPEIFSADDFVHVTVSAAGYLTHREEVKIPQLSPGAEFSPIPLDVQLHRQPIVIIGRTVRFSGITSIPIPSAAVSVIGIWRTAPPANVTIPADPPNLVSLQPPLYSARAASTTTLQRRNLAPVAGSEKTLLDHLLPGANQILLSNRQGLAVGDILLIDDAQPDRTEFISIKNVLTTSSADQPTLVTLDFPVNQLHRRDAGVLLLNPQPAGPTQQVTAAATEGDTCVFLNALSGLTGANEIQISGPSGSDEYHKLLTFTIVSDANGYFRLPPLSRVAQLEIHAEKAVGLQLFRTTVTFRPDYDQRENRLDLALKFP